MSDKTAEVQTPTPDLRCVRCCKEFFEADYPSGRLSGCPACGSTGVPADPRRDQDWTLTQWEWHVLFYLAIGFALAHEQYDPTMKETTLALLMHIMGAEYEGDGLAAPDDPVVQSRENVPLTTRMTSHELRILTIWATNALNGATEGQLPVSDRDVEPILTKLRPQYRGDGPLALTMEDEFGALREHLATTQPQATVEVHYGSLPVEGERDA